MGRRARLIQVGAIVLIVVLSLAAVASAVAAYEVRGLSGDVSQAQAHLPRTVAGRLASSGGMLDQNQITLVSYNSDLAKGTAVLFATAPSHKFSSILSLSPGVRIGSQQEQVPRAHDLNRRHPKHPRAGYRVVTGTPLRYMTVPQTISALRGAGIPVSHVALIDAKDIGPLVSATGGITVANKTPFTTTADGKTVSFGKGTLRLDAPHAAAYVEAATTREPLGAAENAALVGIVNAVLAPSSVGQVQSVGQALSRATATDLSTADVIGLVDMRIRGGELVQCRVRGPGNLADPGPSAIVNQALGRTATHGPSCHARQLAAAPVVPPKAVVEAVQHYGWQLFAGIAVILAVVAILLAAALRAYWPMGRARYYY